MEYEEIMFVRPRMSDGGEYSIRTLQQAWDVLDASGVYMESARLISDTERPDIASSQSILIYHALVNNGVHDFSMERPTTCKGYQEWVFNLFRPFLRKHTNVQDSFRSIVDVKGSVQRAYGDDFLPRTLNMLLYLTIDYKSAQQIIKTHADGEIPRECIEYILD